ncbi:shikimate dehydrogenase [Flavobacterium sp. CYK-55]|uniref:shikimate dehydrogenase family protein n=1 Tax=Flavobacterium sp. CYK-55 TaxID=2835529 RepID=UPI001BCB2221|nr:shikimate dehydrogenase [Flavobacterium sp. CYK-55]MBS7787948.1 shikimate dehydrogenase [Flavobacterium sp. CYK-55]
MTKLYGLIGKNIGYSFSKKYFTDRFAQTGATDCVYENFDLAQLEEFKKIIAEHSNLCGLNVTIPYKEAVIPYLDELSIKAQKIGAVNVIRFKNGKLKGYNSDAFGFKKSIKPLLKPHHKKALILGTGGASKAVAFALEELNILYSFASRNDGVNTIKYEHINATTFDNFQIFIHCTPLGTYPNINTCPDLPYEYFSEQHLAFDLIYNPEETLFLKKAKNKGAQTQNGQQMLINQAEKAWRIWNK